MPTAANRSIAAVAFSPDSKTVAAGGLSLDKTTETFGGVLELWNAKTGALLSTLATASNGGVLTVAFSPDGKTLAVGGTGNGGGVLELWNVSTGTLSKTLSSAANSGVTSVAFSRDGKTLAVGGYNNSGQENGVVELWNATTLSRIAVLNAGGEEGVLSVAFSSDGSILFVGTSGNMQAFSVASKSLLEQYSVGQVSSVTVSPSGNQLAYGTENGEVGVAGTPTFTTVTVVGLAITPTTIIGGNTATGTVTIAQPAPAGGVFVMVSSNSSSATAPAELNIAGGATTATFTVTTKGVDAQTIATITAGNSIASKSVALTLNPAMLASVTLNPTAITGGTSSTGTVALSGKAGPSGVVVSLTSNNAVASVPKTVTIPSGHGSATFTITSIAVSAQKVATLSAKFGTTTQTALLTVNPPTLMSISVAPTSVFGGASSVGVVTLGTPAGVGGIKISLASNVASVTVPASVTIPANQLSATFNVKTVAVPAQKVATLTAKFNGVSQTVSLTVNPPALSTLVLNPVTVKGGKAATATVSLTSAAPAGGVKVSVTSNQASATAPATVTIPAGKTTATFTVTTKAVKSSTSAKISITLSGASVSATLTIT